MDPQRFYSTGLAGGWESSLRALQVILGLQLPEAAGHKVSPDPCCPEYHGGSPRGHDAHQQLVLACDTRGLLFLSPRVSGAGPVPPWGFEDSCLLATTAPPRTRPLLAFRGLGLSGVRAEAQGRAWGWFKSREQEVQLELERPRGLGQWGKGMAVPWESSRSLRATAPPPHPHTSVLLGQFGGSQLCVCSRPQPSQAADAPVQPRRPLRGHHPQESRSPESTEEKVFPLKGTVRGSER